MISRGSEMSDGCEPLGKLMAIEPLGTTRSRLNKKDCEVSIFSTQEGFWNPAVLMMRGLCKSFWNPAVLIFQANDWITITKPSHLDQGEMR